MIDRRRLNDELRRLRELIRTDPRVLARVDRNGDGSIDGEEWERARRAIVGRLEQEVVNASAPPAGELAREVYEQELRTDDEPEADLPRMGTTNHLILEWPVNISVPRRLRHIGPQWEFTVLSGDRAELGGFERLTELTVADRRYGPGWKENEQYYSIRPHDGENVLVRRYPTALGEALAVCSVNGRTIADVQPKVRVLRYAYRIKSEDDRTLLVEPRDWDERCEQGFRRSGGRRERPRSRKRFDPYHLVDGQGRWAGFIDSEVYFPDPQNRRKYFRQWVLRLEPETLTPALRWGLIGTLAFILNGPSLFRGWLWSLFGTRRH
jgi:hypothetical protein